VHAGLPFLLAVDPIPLTRSASLLPSRLLRQVHFRRLPRLPHRNLDFQIRAGFAQDSNLGFQRGHDLPLPWIDQDGLRQTLSHGGVNLLHEKEARQSNPSGVVSGVFSFFVRRGGCLRPRLIDTGAAGDAPSCLPGDRRSDLTRITHSCNSGRLTRGFQT
jgi:hypothetical protein